MIRPFLLLNLALVLLQACSTSPPPIAAVPELPTVMNLKIISDANVNADMSGGGAPVVLRIYQLRETSGFNSADFFSIFDKDQMALAGEMAHKQELLIKPNDQKNISLHLEPDIKVLGFFAAFRQLDTAQWRATIPVAAHQEFSAEIKFKDNRLIVESIKKEEIKK